jgi:hypothetical protein
VYTLNNLLLSSFQEVAFVLCNAKYDRRDEMCYSGR